MFLILHEWSNYRKFNEIISKEMEQRLNIIIIGLANSGSSAVQDLLTEYNSVGRFRYEEPNFITGELNHFRLRGMIADQLYPNVVVEEQFLLPQELARL